MKNKFSFFNFAIKIEKWKLRKIYHFSIFNFEFKIEMRKNVLFHFIFNPCTESIIRFWFKNKTNFEKFSFFVFQFHNQNWRMKEFFEIQFLIFNRKMNSKILILVFWRPCIFRPFNFQQHFLIKNWFLPQFSIQFNIYFSNEILNIKKQIN